MSLIFDCGVVVSTTFFAGLFRTAGDGFGSTVDPLAVRRTEARVDGDDLTGSTGSGFAFSLCTGVLLGGDATDGVDATKWLAGDF